MKSFYNVTDQIKNALIAEPFVNNVTFGSLNDVDLDKQTLFPLGHMTVNSTNVATNVLRFNISILVMDIVDISTDKVIDKFIGNDNEQDVLNTTLAVLTRVLNKLQKGDLYSTKYQIEDTVGCEPFVDRFENKLAGWAATFDVVVQNDMTIC
ncbi:MAG: hypothetical protein CBC03_12095 [Pseudoalteromonas sp. TMED43]|nr:MAG: hypothetical protein CBC03_12095 [Pseudoalteromonas sp. TMED43]|tara:strand:+ start:893 stop:1348 length:456 start_codon:yes stop_codon:yes gene_type:complete